MKDFFKKIGIFLLGFLTSFTMIPGIAHGTLWEYYQEKGEKLPSVEERIPLAQKAGIENYRGTYGQNTILEKYLRESLQLAVPPNGMRGNILGGTPTPTSSAKRAYVEAPDHQLFDSAFIGDETITLNTFQDIYGNSLSMSDFGDLGYGRLNPDGEDISESFTFSGVTTNSDGTVTLTGVSSTLAKYPYTPSDGLTRSHGIGTIVRVSDTAAFFDTFANKENDELIDGQWEFTTSYPEVNSSVGNATTSRQLITLTQAQSLTNQGAATSTESVAGISELATQTEMASGTDLGVDRPLVLQAKYATSSPQINDHYLVVSEKDGFINQSWFDLSQDFSWTGEHDFSATTTFTTTTADSYDLSSGEKLTPTFGGDGSDGALTVTAGNTTTVDLGSSNHVIKNYTSINIADGAGLDFTNPSASGTVVIIRVQEDVIIDGRIDLSHAGTSGVGAAAGIGGAAVSGLDVAGKDGTVGSSTDYALHNSNKTTDFGEGGPSSGSNTGGGAESAIWDLTEMYTRFERQLSRRSIVVTPGQGGGGGGSGSSGTETETSGAGGDGGRGGGSLIMEVAGDLTFSSTAVIDVSGEDGTDGTDASSSGTGSAGGGGGGGGGAAGSVVILYDSLVDNSGTINKSGGNGGNGGDGFDNGSSNGSPAGAGGAGASSPISLGGSGGNGTWDGSSGGSGGNATNGGSGGSGGSGAGDEGGGGGGGGGGADGFSLIAENLWF